MTLQEAEKIRDDFIENDLKNRRLNYEPYEDKNEKKGKVCKSHCLLPDGSYVFFYDGPYTGNPFVNPTMIVVRKNDKEKWEAFELYGAIGKFFPNLGMPKTGERWIGSGSGRYQLFDKGIIQWDGTNKMKGVSDLAYPSYIDDKEYEGNKRKCVIAFMDIRNFTVWSQGKNISEISELIKGFEERLQKYFSNKDIPAPFFKGVGDGFMIIVEEPYNNKNGDCISKFIEVCCKCGKELTIYLKGQGCKGVGIGIDAGELTNILILGRWDYLGGPINRASKIQHCADNELIYSEECYNSINDKNKSIVCQSKECKVSIKEQNIRCKKLSLE